MDQFSTEPERVSAGLATLCGGMLVGSVLGLLVACFVFAAEWHCVGWVSLGYYVGGILGLVTAGWYNYRRFE